ncbi:MAG: hypothetical protein R3B13_15465 [Polyangiaceae bacterium]
MPSTVFTPDDAPAASQDENGVDLTLIRAYQQLTPLECLELLEDAQRLSDGVAGKAGACCQFRHESRVSWTRRVSCCLRIARCAALV